MLRRQQRAGLIAVAIFLGTTAAWSMTTTLFGAVVAVGSFVVAGNVKKVQHPHGGVVGALLVSEGQHVNAGEVVLRLDPTTVKSSHQILAKQIDEATIRLARLEAERQDAPEMNTGEFAAMIAASNEFGRVVAAEAKLFDVRRVAREGRRAQLRKRMSQLADEIKGLSAQRAAKEREAGIIADELAGVEDLYRRKLVQLTRLSTLQREQANIEGQRGKLNAEIAQVEGKIAEIELQIIQIGEDQRADAIKELRDVQARHGELIERRVATEFQLEHIDLRAPSAGVIHQLAVHTIGGVLPAGETAMLIVPGEEALQLDARVRPADIDQIASGQSVRIKVLAGQQSRAPELRGSIMRIGADISRDERDGQPYYALRIAIPPEEFARLAPLRIIAGMQAEAMIETAQRTPLDFILKPFISQFDRAFRER
ncbi:HlyD family type I secretion periplasmic adaptor subunit [Bosea sp. NBC_00550]|uniref:HlyD family type I secretion periplasmic adaptor subunit n=1 Tax=Bosea sp. NBC_00550 TaxID=2969621 RepID=UPI00222FAFC9|nr:HlyD family type I secretion periplasmic adaptor subunit [Bosea sp. NBC_00550]UZF94399.1 HlyD family type I secretion periplasmic adaptor subunit [Bosea sp. NBC_00550]